MLAAIREGLFHGLSHITGGGFAENVPRMLPDGLAARIDTTSWSPPAVFAWLTETGSITPEEMSRTFNCGIGMIAAVRPERVDDALAFLAARGEQAWHIGEVASTGPDEAPVRIDGLAFR